jgi:hypothetical protein
MATIDVVRTGESVYRVTVEENGSRTVHHVTATSDELERYASGVAPERLLTASFEFLLERESKEAILSRFALSVIERYFPDYPDRIRDRLQGWSPRSGAT